MSTPYEANGRTNQKQRTRQALVHAAQSLVQSGAHPTVEQAAERAGVSRTTAYRYFSNNQALMIAAHPETAAKSMLPDDAPADPQSRLDAVVTQFTALIIQTEASQRAMLRISLEPDPAMSRALPLRQGRAIGWITESLEPLRGALGDGELHRLVLAIRSCIGIEALVWLTDIGGLSRQEAAASMRWTAQALLSAAFNSPPPTRLPAG